MGNSGELLPRVKDNTPLFVRFPLTVLSNFYKIVKQARTKTIIKVKENTRVLKITCMQAVQQQHVISVGNPWFEYLKAGKKTWEGRCYWKAALSYKIGDTFEVKLWTSPSQESIPAEPFKLKIEEIRRFSTFEEALKQLGVESVLPEVKTLEEAVKIYLQFVSLKTQQDNGVAMFRVSKVD